MANPLPIRLTSGIWMTIGNANNLVPLDVNHVLDWVPNTGDYRVWLVNSNAIGVLDPLPTLITQGNWITICTGHQSYCSC